jgi:hypothetical protein
MDHQFKILHWFGQKWSDYKKDEPFKATVGNRNGYAIAFEVGSLRVLFAATMGPKGGITGALVVMDTSQQIEIDRLLCSDFAIMRSENPIVQLDIAVHIDKQDFNQAAPEFLADTMCKWKKNPTLVTTMADLIGFGQPSVETVTGGTVSPR